MKLGKPHIEPSQRACSRIAGAENLETYPPPKVSFADDSVISVSVRSTPSTAQRRWSFHSRNACNGERGSPSPAPTVRAHDPRRGAVNVRRGRLPSTLLCRYHRRRGISIEASDFASFALFALSISRLRRISDVDASVTA
jgi:hypothetical protein